MPLLLSHHTAHQTGMHTVSAAGHRAMTCMAAMQQGSMLMFDEPAYSCLMLLTPLQPG
jgi:hypothetical protein